MPKSATVPFIGSSEIAVSTAIILSETVKLMVARPDQVRVLTETTSASVTFLVKVAPEDLAAVVGKGGRTASSLRVLLRAFSRHSDVPFNLDICEGHS